MKEFVEKLIGRLEEERKKCLILESNADTELNEQYFNGKRNAFAETIEFTNQLAEEYGKDTNVTTNADRIRSMNDEEMADFLEEFEACDVCKYLDNNRCTFENPCVHEFAGAMIYDWLQSEVKGSDV